MTQGRRRGPALALVSEVSALPLAPKNPLSIRQLLRAVRNLDAGQEVLRDAGGTVTRIQFGPKWLAPPVVAVFSPSGIRDVLGRNDTSAERCVVHEEVRHLAGDSLFVLPNEPWLPRKRALQPVFTKPNVRNFGGHMSRAAQALCESWPDSGEVDLDLDCRRVTMRSLGRSVLGLDLNDREDVIAESHARRVVLHRRPRSASGARTEVVADARTGTCASCGGGVAQRHRRHAAGVPCRSDAGCAARARVDRGNRSRNGSVHRRRRHHQRPADLHAGRPRHDGDRTHLRVVGAGTSPRGAGPRRRRDTARLGDREITPADVSRLGYTVQVLHEALRLCPPAAGVGRMAVRDFAVDGYRVQAGTLVLVGIYAVHRDPDVWPEPLEFDPDRFSPEAAEGARPLAVHSVRGWFAIVHRRTLRAAGDHPCAGHHRPGQWRSGRSTTTFPSTCRSPRSPRGRSARMSTRDSERAIGDPGRCRCGPRCRRPHARRA